MLKQSGSSDPEFETMQTIYQALESMDDEARSRVLRYVISRLQVADVPSSRQQLETPLNAGDGEAAIEQEEAKAPRYSSFAELVDATPTNTNADRALVAGYWLQVCGGAENFDALSVNKELKNLGLGVGNITVALDTLRTQNPSLALQLKKSGKSQQARKTYKLTVAGIRAVENMISSAATG